MGFRAAAVSSGCITGCDSVLGTNACSFEAGLYISPVAQRCPSEFPQRLLIGATLASLTGAAGRQRAQPGRSSRLRSGSAGRDCACCCLFCPERLSLQQDSNLAQVYD